MLGIFGGVWWIAYAILVTDPVMAVLGEDLANRLWSPGLAGLCAGFIGFAVFAHPRVSRVSLVALVAAAVGVGLMFLGNLVEYGFLSDLPHQGPGGLWRGIAWMTVLFGVLVLLLALPTAGIAAARSELPRWVPWALGLAVPLTVACALVFGRLAVLPMALLAIALCILLLREARSGPARRGVSEET